MTAERERILESVARGELSPDQADALLKSLSSPRAPRWKWLFSPLELVSTRAALIASSLVAVGALVLSRFSIHLDGALDTHLGSGPVPPAIAALELIVSWPLVALVFWATSRLIAKQGRYVDFLNAVGLARVPLIVSAVALVFFADVMPRTPEQALEQGRLVYSVVFGLVFAVPLMIWFITLLVMGFREASGLRGIRLALSFLAALIAAEVLSKVVLAVVL